jgi:NAD(P)H dehydrogenase (quinone)
MRVFLLYANPNAKSFGAALHNTVVETLGTRGHQVDDCDLYKEVFNPVMSEQERQNYNNTSVNAPDVEHYAERLLRAEALVLVYPVWNEGFPAILKGFFDRVFIPGVSCTIGPSGSVSPSLERVKKLAAVCTYGADRLSTFFLGDPPRRVVKRLVRAMPGHTISCDYLASYNMNRATPASRAAFLTKVQKVFALW